MPYYAIIDEEGELWIVTQWTLDELQGLVTIAGEFSSRQEAELWVYGRVIHPAPPPEPEIEIDEEWIPF